MDEIFQNLPLIKVMSVKKSEEITSVHFFLFFFYFVGCSDGAVDEERNHLFGSVNIDDHIGRHYDSSFCHQRN